jgi:hypothetical protein
MELGSSSPASNASICIGGGPLSIAPPVLSTPWPLPPRAGDDGGRARWWPPSPALCRRGALWSASKSPSPWRAGGARGWRPPPNPAPSSLGRHQADPLTLPLHSRVEQDRQSRASAPGAATRRARSRWVVGRRGRVVGPSPGGGPPSLQIWRKQRAALFCSPSCRTPLRAASTG